MYRTLATIGRRSRNRQLSVAETRPRLDLLFDPPPRTPNPEPYLWPAGTVIDVAIAPAPDQPIGPVVEVTLIPKQKDLK